MVAVFSTSGAFAALKSDASIIAWGQESYGGSLGFTAAELASGVKFIYSTSQAFAALKDDGSIVTWGSSCCGGTVGSAASSLTSGVVDVYPSDRAFAALKDDGSIVAWGGSSHGGSLGAAAASLTTAVTAVGTTGKAFVALKDDGSVVAWGSSTYGGTLGAAAPLLTGYVIAIYTNLYAAVALKADGSLVAWGNSNYGSLPGPILSSVVNVFSADTAFAAMTTDREIVVWPSNQAPSGQLQYMDVLQSADGHDLITVCQTALLHNASFRLDSRSPCEFTFTSIPQILEDPSFNQTIKWNIVVQGAVDIVAAVNVSRRNVAKVHLAGDLSSQEGVPDLVCRTHWTSHCLLFEELDELLIADLTISGHGSPLLQTLNVRRVTVRNLNFESAWDHPSMAYLGVIISPRFKAFTLGAYGGSQLHFYNVSLRGSFDVPGIAMQGYSFILLDYIASSHHEKDRFAANTGGAPNNAISIRDSDWVRCLHRQEAILAFQDISKLQVKDVLFANHYCRIGCTPLQLQDIQHIAMANVTFLNNTCADCSGGGMSLNITRWVPICAFKDITFTQNSGRYGGGLAITDTTNSLQPWRFPGILANITFLNNTAKEVGGGLYWHSRVKYMKPPGIPLELQDNPPTLLLSSLVLAGNQAPCGGGSAVESVNVVATDLYIEGNVAGVQGGGMWLKSSSAVFSKSTWKANSLSLAAAPSINVATMGGGGLFSSGCLTAGIVAIHASFVNNSAVGHGDSYMYGGGIHVRGCTLVLDSMELQQNSAMFGGAVMPQ